MLKGTSTGTVTDVNGNYTLDVDSSDGILVFSSVGFTAEEVPINGRNEIDISMAPDIQSLSEVVVIGYGTKQKSDLTGSVSTISNKEISKVVVTSPEQALQGRVAGVQLTQASGEPGGGVRVRIRGGNSIIGGNEPLYVVDGFPINDPSNAIDPSGGQTSPSSLNAINPNDIASINVLKDASATAIYGARGANGVVIITTKSGKAGTSQVDLQYTTGIQQVTNKLDLLNAEQFTDLMNEQATLDGRDLPFPAGQALPYNTDWQDVAFRTARISTYDLSFSGANQKTNYFLSANYFDQEGVLEGSDFQRGSIRINVDQNISDRFKVSSRFLLSRTINDRVNANNEGGDPRNYMDAVVANSPTQRPFNENGTYTDPTDFPFRTADQGNNVVALGREIENRLSTNRVLANVAANYEFVPSLNLDVKLGVDYNDVVADNYATRLISFGLNSNGAASKRSTQLLTYLNESILTYNKKIGEAHQLNVVGGFTWQQQKREGFGASSSGFVLDDLGNDNLGSGSNFFPPSSFASQWTLISYLARINYTLYDKYLFTVSGRADGSSRFGTNNKWGFFPSGAIAWRVSNESFMENISTVSDLKIRASVGITGNTEIGIGQSLSRLSSTSNTILGISEGQNIGFVPANLANPDLKWERTTQYDLGLDVGLFANRLTFTADYYVKETNDLLAQVPLPGSSGFNTSLQNIGQVRNNGVELSVTGILSDRSFQWSVSANIARNRNEVISLANGSEFFAGSFEAPITEPMHIIREGEPLASFYGYVEDGLFSNQADVDNHATQANAVPGGIKIRDLNNDGEINDDDKRILGNPYPDFNYGFTSTMEFKGFDLSIFIQGDQGRDVLNLNLASYADGGSRGFNQVADVVNRWTPENPNPNAPFPSASAAAVPWPSDRLVEDASFLRLQNVTLGYNLPLKNLSIDWLRALRVYVTGQNLLTFTNYTWFDPEVDIYSGNQSGGFSDLRIGTDWGSYPRARIIQVGVRIGL